MGDREIDGGEDEEKRGEKWLTERERGREGRGNRERIYGRQGDRWRGGRRETGRKVVN